MTIDQDMFDFEMAADRKRTMKIGNDVYVLQATDPYGFWTVSKKNYRGADELPGTYTSLIEAEKAARKHAAPKPKVVVSSGFKSEKKEVE